MTVTKAYIYSDVVSDVVTNPNNEKALLENFGYIPNKGEFIERIMNEGCFAYVKKVTITSK